MQLLIVLPLLAAIAAAKPPVSFKGVLDVHPIWMDLDMPEADGKVTGTYLYLKHGKPIRLEGNRKGQDLRLTEILNGKVTGTFKLTLGEIDAKSGDLEFSALEEWQLSGTWSKAGRKSALHFGAIQVDPAYRSCALIPPDSLRISGYGPLSLGAEIQEHVDGEFSNPLMEGKPIYGNFDISACGRGLMSTKVSWCYTAANKPAASEMGSTRRVFDTARKVEVVLAEEIAPEQRKAFVKFMSPQLKPAFEEYRGKLLDSSVIEIGEEDGFEIYLAHETLFVGRTLEEREDPNMWIIQPVEIFVPVPYRKLKAFLKKESVLHKLANGP